MVSVIKLGDYLSYVLILFYGGINVLLVLIGADALQPCWFYL